MNFRSFTLLVLFIGIVGLMLPESNVYAQLDPTGEATGTKSEIATDSTGAISLESLAETAGHTKISLNFVWLLFCAFLVMFMQAGFAMVETGFTRAKNVAHTMGMNFLVYALGVLGFYISGFALMFGGVGAIPALGGNAILDSLFTINLFGKEFGLFGMKGFFLNDSVYDVSIYSFFLFQMVFMDTTATIPTGSMAERWKFKPFMFYALFISMIVYPIYGNWVWGMGWLSQLGVNFGLGHGHVDFAGSSVVHLVGGVAALAGAIVIGPRIGKYGKKGQVYAIPGHNIPMAMVGTFILAFGWFGFNAGSSFSGNDLRIGVVATNTMIASASGAVFATLYMMWKYKKPDPSMMANGMLAGLVAITGPCAFVNSYAAFTIGAVAGLLVIFAVFFIDQKLKIDDPVGAVAVHGVNGIWGLIALGLFADGSYGAGWNGVEGGVRGLFYGDASQLVAQIIGILAAIIFVFPLMYGFFKIQDKFFGGIRVSAKDEEEGLDMPEMGVYGYDDRAVNRAD